jgi:hypothetical protein
LATLASRVKEQLIKFFKEQIVLGLTLVRLSTLTHIIHHEKAIIGITFSVFGFTSIRVNYCKPTIDIWKNAHKLNTKLNWTGVILLVVANTNHPLRFFIFHAPTEV